MKTIVLTGGTGFIGSSLSQYFKEAGYHIIILSRKPQKVGTNFTRVQWDGKNLGNWCDSLEGADVVINLTGKSVDCRYSKKNREEIYSSRLNATEVIGKAITLCKKPPGLWINAGSATIYRHSLDKPMDEETGELGTGFSVDVCKEWERAFENSITPQTRKVVLRIAIVLGKNGGVLKPLANLTRFWLGGKQGKGNQFFSWIHEKDLARIIEFVINNSQLSGILNASVPNPVTNSDLMSALRSAYDTPVGLNLSELILEIGAFFIRTETELIFKSRRVVPARLINAGFKFEYSHLGEALADLVPSPIESPRY